MRLQGVLALAAVVALLALSLPVLGQDAGPEPAAVPMLKIGSQDQMKTRNVLAAGDDPFTMAVLARVYDTPVQRDAVTGGVVPRLAVGTDQNGDGRLDPSEVGDFTVSFAAPNVTVFYDFTNARFHDGTPLTIGSVLFSYHLLALNQRMNGPIRVLMNASVLPADRWLRVLPVDDGDGNPATAALRFSPRFPYPDFAWATLGIPILPRHLFEETGGGRHPVTGTCTNPDWGLAIYPETDPRFGQGVPTSETTYLPFNYACAEGWQMTDADVVGSGHFRFVAWVFGVYTQLDANLDYAFGSPRVATIQFLMYRTTQLGILALKSGEIDFYNWNVPPEFLPDLQSDPNIVVVDAPPLFPATVVFNVRRQPFGYTTYPPVDSRLDDQGLAFRRAFDQLIDRTTLVRVLLQNQGLVADGMIAPTNDGWYNTSLPAVPYNTTTAASILDTAGWIDTDADGWREFPRLGDAQFDILTPQADFDPILASTGAMIAAATRSIGVNVVSRPTAFGAILQALAARSFDIAILSHPDAYAIDPWTLMRGDPDYLYDLFHSSRGPAGRNHAGFYDTPFDAIIEAASAETDFANRSRDVQDAESLLADRVPAIPMFYRNYTWVYRADRFQGWTLITPTILNYWSLQALIQVVPPVASFTIVPNPVDVGVPVAFDASASSDPDGTIVAYDWDLGDGSTATGVTTSHAYATPGTYTVILTVTDNDSFRDTATKWIVVNGPNAPPVASFAAAPNPVEAGVAVGFDASASSDPDGFIAAYSWSFGDGAFANGVAPSHAYASAGTFTVSLTVTDNRSAQDTASTQVVVTPNPGPQISLVSPPEGAVIPRGTVIDLTVTDSDLASVRYSLDGALPSVLSAPWDIDTSTWAEGPHTAEVTAEDSVGNATAASYSFTIDSLPPEIALVAPANNSLVRGGTVLDFSMTDAHLTGASIWIDAGTPAGFAPPYDVPMTGLADGRHTFRIDATDAAGNTATREFAVTLDATAPTVVDSGPRGNVTGTIASISVRFSEPVDRSSAEAAFSLTDGVLTWDAGDGSFFWTSDNAAFVFIPDAGIARDTAYEVRLAGTLTDVAGNPMGSDVRWSFRFPSPPPPGPVGVDPLWIVAAILATVAVVALLALLMRRRSRGERTPPEPPKP